jgi:hypothetical protein
MELWIVAGLALAALVAVIVLRFRSRRVANRRGETGNIYPLW